MIKKGSKSIASIMKGNKVIQYIYKGALLVYQAMKKSLVSGVFPLTLENTVGSDLTNYKIEGNTYSTLADDANNIFSSYGVSARDITSTTGQRILINNYGTTINSIDYTGEIVATQKQAPNTSSVISYENGFFCLGLNGLEVGKTYTLFYNFEVLDNPLNVKNTDVAMINGTNGIYATYSGNLAKHTFVWDKYTGYESREYIELRLCGRSMKYSNFAIYEGEIQDFPVVSIESVGTKTINLFNPANWEGLTTSDVGITVQYLKDEDCFLLNGTAISTGRFAEKYINLPIIKGSVFSITTEYVSGSIHREVSSNYAVAYFGAYDNIDNRTNWIGTNLYDYNNKNENIVCNYNYITALWFYVSEGVRFNNYKVKIQLQEGETATKYEPYGYKIPVKVSKNLFNKNGLSLYGYTGDTFTVDGVQCAKIYQTDGEYGISISNIFKENTQYSLKFREKYVGTKGYVRIDFIYTDETIGKVLGENSTSNWTTRIATSDKGKTVSKIRISNAGNGSSYAYYIDLDSFQLEEGLTIQEPIITNIYLNEPLRKVGDYADYIEFKNQKLIRKVKMENGTLQILDNPTEETIELPSIPTLEGTTVLDSDVTVQPSNVEVEYTNEKSKTISFVMANGDTFLDANGNTFILKEG